MKLGSRNTSRMGLFLCMFLLIFSSVGLGIVLHPGGEPDLATWTNRPDPNVVGKWIRDVNETNWRGSCVAVAPKYVITTRHQTGGAESIIEIDGEIYTIEQIWNHPDNPNPTDPNFKIVDLRLVRLADADLQSYVDVFTDFNEVDEPNIVIGGFGLGRDPNNDLTTGGKLYGYSWQNRDFYLNHFQRWCTNEPDSTVDDKPFLPSYNLDTLIADFDDPGETVYEGSIAEFDSGGGWFIKDGNTWKVAGLSFATDHGGQSWFRNNINPNSKDPDKIYAIRLSSYADWILDYILVEGDLTGDYRVDLEDFARLAGYWQLECNAGNNWCEGADFEPADGTVGIFDLDWLMNNWLND